MAIRVAIGFAHAGNSFSAMQIIRGRPIFVAFAALLLYGCNEPTAKEVRAPRQHKGPYVAEEMVMSPTETLKIVRIPDPLASDVAMLDKRCLIYLNRDLGTSNMVCLDTPASTEDDAKP